MQLQSLNRSIQTHTEAIKVIIVFVKIKNFTVYHFDTTLIRWHLKQSKKFSTLQSFTLSTKIYSFI